MPGQAHANPLVSNTNYAATNNSRTTALDSPVDPATGSLVYPMDLPQYLQDNDWARPNCFCSIRGPSVRKAVLLTPKRRESVAFGMMCLVCPESECPYFGTDINASLFVVFNVLIVRHQQ